MGSRPEPEPANLLEKGFKIELVYDSRNTARQIQSEVLKQGLESLNPGEIQIKVTSWSGPSTKKVSRAKGVAIMAIGWAPDFPDPDDYVNPYRTGGTLASRVGFSNATIDALIDDAAADLNPVTNCRRSNDPRW